MSAEKLDGSIVVTLKGAIATIEFGHVSGNSFPRVLLNKLTLSFQELSREESVSIIILKSQGNSIFCSGASFDELLCVQTEAEGTEFFSGFAHLLNAMRSCSKIIIGRVQGKAVGGGVGIIAACDYVIATTESTVKLSELSIGIGPFVIEPAISRKIGKAAMTELTLRSTVWHSAQWALDNKLFTTLCSFDVLDHEVNTFAEQISSYSPEALVALKGIIWEGTEIWESVLYERAALSGKLVLSPAARLALSQFKNKNK